MNLVDTSGWLEYFFLGKNAACFSSPIEQTKELIVPTICLYEVFKKINMVADEAKALQAIAQMKQAQVVNVSEDVALRASLISIKHKLAMADSIIYATANIYDAILWTQDIDFKDLPNVKYKKKL
jgi:predicted nucleic acid-binding protein